MTEDQKNQPKNDPHPADIARRDFVALSVAAGLAATASRPRQQALRSSRPTSRSRRPMAPATPRSFTPRSGSHPGVLIWPDAFGLRPSMRDMAKRLAAEGYSVLVPNPFYRVSKAPFTDASNFNFQNQADMAKLKPLMASVNAPGNAEKDAVAYVAFLDAQKEVNKSKKIGTQGYCMGGPLVVKTAAALPNRIGAGGSFHGGGLVTDKPDSPHLLAPKIKARMYFGIAANDDHASTGRERQAQRSVRGRARFPRRSKYIQEPCMAGACRTCPSRTASRSITSPTPSAPGGNSSRCTRWRWRNRYPIQLRATKHQAPDQSCNWLYCS